MDLRYAIKINSLIELNLFTSKLPHPHLPLNKHAYFMIDCCYICKDNSTELPESERLGKKIIQLNCSLPHLTISLSFVVVSDVHVDDIFC